MQNKDEVFVELPQEKAFELNEDFSEETVSIGDEFELAGRKFRVRKITKKDIICRPLDWNQEVESKEEISD